MTDVAAAAGLALTLAGPAVYRTLVVDCRWTEKKYVDWMSHTLAQALLPAAPVEGS